jgi:hypothetical protein
MNVTINDGSCQLALLSVRTPNTAIMFHVINDSALT